MEVGKPNHAFAAERKKRALAEKRRLDAAELPEKEGGGETSGRLPIRVGDSAKAESNIRKHGVTFDEATTVFSDSLSMLRSDPDHSLDEQRFIVLGMSSRHRLLVVAFADRPPPPNPPDFCTAGDAEGAETI